MAKKAAQRGQAAEAELGQPHPREEGRLAAVRQHPGRIPPESLTRNQLEA